MVPEEHARRALSRSLEYLHKIPRERIADLIGTDASFRETAALLTNALLAGTRFEIKAPPEIKAATGGSIDAGAEIRDEISNSIILPIKCGDTA